MSLPNEAIEKLFREIETQALLSQQQINVVKGQIAAKQRDVRLLQLTSSEVGGLSGDTNVYEGVGKMFVSSPISVVNKRLSAETSELNSDISALSKKLHYLETTHKNSREHMEQIFKSQGCFIMTKLPREKVETMDSYGVTVRLCKYVKNAFCKSTVGQA